MMTAPVAQPTTPAELVVASDVVTVFVPVKSSKPGMVCRVNKMDWPLMLNVISEGPDVSNASRSEDMGGVKLPDAVSDDVGGGVMVGTDGKDDVFGGTVTKMLYVLVVALEVPAVGGMDGASLVGSWLLWEAEIVLVENEGGEPLEFELN